MRWGAWIGAVALLSACNGGNGGPQATSATVPIDPIAATAAAPSTTARPTTTTTPGPESVEAAVARAFFAHWDAYVTILEHPDVTNPLIDRHFTGTTREVMLDLASQYIAIGKAIRRPADPSLFRPGIQRVEILGPTEAVVVECTLDGLVQFSTADGSVIDDDIVEVHTEVRLQFVDGLWKVSDVSPAGEQEPPCEL